MNRELPLYRPALYNPALWSREETKSYFVARQPLLARIVDDLRRERPGARPQHRLILGLRGMGKSTLLRRIAIAVEDDAELGARWLPLTFPEEQYNVATLADFWLNCLDALSDLMERRGDIEAVQVIDREVASLDRKSAESVLAVLLNATGKTRRRLLLLVDNIDLILGRLKREEWPFREALQSHPEIALIGASASALEATYEYGAAFYDFFKVDELRGLTEPEMRDTILTLARLRGVEEPIRRALDEPGRLRILHTLTGGNPRTAVLLYGVLLKGMDGDVRADLDGLLDEVTPLYKARFEELPPLSQQLMDKLALHWDPMSARQLADALGWEVNLVSAQLARLTEIGVVEKVKAGQGKRAAFQVGERFFNIWYLMRASRRVRRKLVWFVDFLRVFHTGEKLRREARTRLLREGGGPRDVEYILALSRALGREPLALALETRALEALCAVEPRAPLADFLDLIGDDRDLAPKVERIGMIAEMRKSLPTMLRRAQVRFSAPAFVERVLSLPLGTARRRELLERMRGWSARDFAGYRRTLIASARETERGLGSHVFRALRRAVACGEMEDMSDREGAAAAAVRFSCPVLALLPMLSDALHGRSGSNEAESIARQALDLEPEGSYYWHVLGSVLSRSPGHAAEAERAYRRALELQPDLALLWVELGQLLRELPRRQRDAEAAFRRAVGLEPSNAMLWEILAGYLVFDGNGDADDTESTVRRASELAPNDPESWVNLAAFFTTPGHYPAAYEAIIRAEKYGPRLPHVQLIAAMLALFVDQPSDAIRHFGILVDELGREDVGPEVLGVASLVGFALKKGLGAEVLEVLDRSGVGERWRPLREALAAAVAGDAALLNGVAPEVRAPALEILRDIAPQLFESEP